jgi:hypothetical protein
MAPTPQTKRIIKETQTFLLQLEPDDFRFLEVVRFFFATIQK